MFPLVASYYYQITLDNSTVMHLTLMISVELELIVFMLILCRQLIKSSYRNHGILVQACTMIASYL